MRNLFISVALMVLPLSVSGHHSRAGFDMSALVEFEGVLREVIWRNPHIGFVVGIANDQGVEEDWRIEGVGSLYTLERTGVSEDDFQIGDRIQLAGYVSTRSQEAMLSSHMLLSDGTEAILDADAEPRWVDGNVGGRDQWLADQEKLAAAAAEDLGIFRVWSPAGYGSTSITRFDVSLTDAAIASRESWDPYDNFATRCEPAGMPIAMRPPSPFLVRRTGR